MSHRKPPERRQGHRSHTPTLVVASQPPDITPAPPTGLLRATQAAWVEFWSSPLAGLLLPADLPALQRLFELLDERTRCWRAFRKRRLVTGSQGQPVLHPIARWITALDSEIRPLQDRFGLTPAARLRLGIQLGEAARSLEELNATFDDGQDSDNGPDPRLTAADPSTVESG